MSVDPAMLRELATLEALMDQRGIARPKPPAPPREISAEDAALSPLAWAGKYRRIDGKPFGLARHKPLAAIYDDPSQTIVIMKPAQVGT